MSDNQVTEPIETACFCKHGNLGQHESDCPKCPLHFTRGELNALQRERDQLRADMAKVREERDAAYLVQSRLRSQMEGKMECGHLRQYGTCGEVFPVHCLACANATLTAELEQVREAIVEYHTDKPMNRKLRVALAAIAARLAAKTEK